MPYLPHIYPVGAIFFITFRFGDSLPQIILQKLKAEFSKKEQEIKKLHSDKGVSQNC